MDRMTQDELKRLVAEAALAYVAARQPSSASARARPSTTSSTPWRRMRRARRRRRLEQRRQHGAAGVARHPACSTRARSSRCRVCVDGADEIDPAGCMIKGGGAALTREKIVADLAERFVCIADESKLVDRLGRFPLPVEVIPMAAAQVARRFVARRRPGAAARRRRHRQRRRDPRRARPGHRRPGARSKPRSTSGPASSACGIFARHRATVCLLGTAGRRAHPDVLTQWRRVRSAKSA